MRRSSNVAVDTFSPKIEEALVPVKLMMMTKRPSVQSDISKPQINPPRLSSGYKLRQQVRCGRADHGENKSTWGIQGCKGRRQG